jgi:hypothetical protein
MRLRQFLLGGFAALLCASLASAQVVTTGTIVVVVEAEDGSRLPGATVTATASDTTTRREVVSDAQGEATLVSLEPSAQYVVTVAMPQFATVRNERILVRSGQTTTLPVSLKVSSVSEEITVTGESPLVDTTSATQGQDITLELTESLPTGRSYQSYLQLVPGVSPDNPDTATGNPASKSGVNYSDIAGDIGISTDNFYYIDGINVTDGVTGTFGANMNTEIIQEQKVLTGGIPAEFVGTPGLLSNVVTKSGSNDFHGSVNYFAQNDSLVADNQNLPNADFSTYDTALTIGGPIVKDKAWFFGSYRRVSRDDQVVALDTGDLLRSVENRQDQFYARGTWSPTANDTLSFTFLNDPTDISGRREPDIANSQNRSRVQGGNRYNASYTRLLGSAVLDLGYTYHNGEVSDFATIREAANQQIFRSSDSRTLADEQLGGWGSDIIDQRDTELYRASLQYNLDRHTLKGGVEFAKNKNFRNGLTVEDAIWYSLTPHLSGLTADDVANESLTGLRFDVTNPSDFDGFINTVNGLPNRDSFYAAYDTNGDGTITPAELGAGLRFDSASGNPNGLINYSRFAQVQDGEQNTSSQGLSFFAQDTAQFGRLTINAGLRLEKYDHFNTLDETIFTFDWTVAPRASLIWDIKGDGKQKISAYYGKYYDPIRNNMTNFAGSHSGRTREEQVFANGQWVNYRTRGGSSFDAIFAPETKTPWTEDIQAGYAIDLGRNMSFEALYTHRRTRDILEDYDPHLYSDPSVYPGPIDHPDSLFLPYEHFGFDPAGLAAGTEFCPAPCAANFFIATLEGGERNYQGIDLIFRKRFADRWQALVAYTFNDAEGSSNSDSNADFQGDVLFLDPRAPNQLGVQPGSIDHLFKAAASYRWDFGIQLGAVYRWNSGSHASRTFRASGRNLPIRDAAPTEFAGITNTRWIAADTVGVLENPSYGLLDFRVEYVRNFDKFKGELFVDIFNVLDEQDGIRLQDVVAGVGANPFGDEIQFNAPRRFFLGARLSF